MSTRYGSYFIGTSFPEYTSISLVKSRCTRDPVYVGPGYVYRSRRGILTKPWNKLQIREIESLANSLARRYEKFGQLRACKKGFLTADISDIHVVLY